MSYNDLLDHKCDIYHIKRSDKSPGYNLPSSPLFTHLKDPDIAEVPCHFNAKGSSVAIAQGEPKARYIASIKLNLPADTDVRLNDKIVDCDTGYEYTAGIPRNVRGHHIAVIVRRTDVQEPL